MKTPKLNFRRLVSNLPFNPSLINQVSFYSKRLRQETSTRRLGFLFIALAFLVQIFAVVSPPQTSSANPGNDIMPGGFNSQAEGVNDCVNNAANYGKVLAAFGVTCDNLKAGTARHIDYSEQPNLYSIGYTAYSKPGEQPVDIPSLGVRVFARPLVSWGAHCWDDGRGCRGIVGHKDDGSFFMVLFSCGNLVTVGPPRVVPPPPPPPPPPPTPAKQMICSVLNMSVADGAHVPLNSTISLIGQATGHHLPDGQKVDMHYNFSTTAAGVTPTRQHTLNVPFGPHGYATDTETHSYALAKPGRYTFTLAITYDGTKTAQGNETGGCVKTVYVDNEVCKNPNDHQSCTVENKRARNITRNINDANNTTAQPGDVIEYSLSVTNTLQSTTTKNFVIKDQIGDILEYADPVDLGGGKIDSQKNIVWPAVNIKPKETVTKKFTVKVKNPLPQTPVSVSNPGSFDLTMTNVYGDTINVKLPGSPAKIVEQTTTSLPNTGPGQTIAIGFTLCAFVGYFLARSRLLNQEMDLVRQEYTTGA